MNDAKREIREIQPEKIVDVETLRRAKEAAEQAVDLDNIKRYISESDLEGLDARGLAFLSARVNQETGDRLRWKHVSCNYKMMNDVELLFATSYDVEFVRTHQVVAGLIDTAIFLAREKKIKSLGDEISRIIYEYIAYGGANGYEKGIELPTLDEHGEFDGGSVDLFDELHLRNIKEAYEAIPMVDRPLSWLEIEKKYRDQRREEFLIKRSEQTGKPHTPKPIEPIEIFVPMRDDQGNLIMNNGSNIPRGRLIKDLFLEVERLTISEKEFSAYYKGIEKYQNTFQDLSTYRDQSGADHHTEKAGHALLGRGLGGAFIYLPSSIEQARDYALGDTAKTTAGFRAQGHVHEYSKGYDELTGISVGWDKRLFETFRGQVNDHYAYGQTRQRNARAALGYAQLEQPIIDTQRNTIWFGRRVLSNGKVQYGKVYSAMSNHYDARYKESRGYGLTEYEKGDKVFTDIVGMHFALNPRDWIMSYYVGAAGDSADNAMRGGRAVSDNKKDQPIFVFFAKLPEAGMSEIGKDTALARTKNSNQYGELTIRGFTALAKYTDWRISLGDIPEVTSMDIDVMVKLSKETEKKAVDPKAGEESKKEEAKTPEKKWDRTVDVPLFGSLLGELFGTQWSQVIHILAGRGGSITLEVSGETITIQNEVDLLNYLYKVIENKKDLLKQLKDTSKETGTMQAVRYFIQAIKLIATDQDIVTPDVLKLNVAVAGAKDVNFQKPSSVPPTSTLGETQRPSTPPTPTTP